MIVFLSYAEEDGHIGSLIAQRLSEQKHQIFDWQSPGRRGRFMPEIEEGIRKADAFIAVLSPSYMESYWCRQELDMALQRERALQEGRRGAIFIHVVEAAEMLPADAGTLGNYAWEKMTSPAHFQTALSRMALRFSSAGAGPDSPVPQPRPPQAVHMPRGHGSELASRDRGDEELAFRDGEDRAPGAGTAVPAFRNREEELDKVLRGLTNPVGPHFWLVIAPPQLGKTWFLRRVSEDPALAGPVPWVIRHVNLRSQPPGVITDPAALLALLFGRRSAAASTETFREIAREISRSKQPHLCLLDSAELLSVETARQLRACLGQVYRLVPTSNENLRLAFVAASRRDDDWKGVTPVPRVSALPLTEFNTEVVQEALHDVLRDLGMHGVSAAELHSNAVLIHRLTEGLPALLVNCLEWIKEWAGVDTEPRLRTPELFEELAGPYIRQRLLSRASLLPASHTGTDEPMRALEHAYRLLAPYRLFTQSHLRHHMESDPGFRAALAAAGWDMTDLSAAINETALLRRPLDEPWKEIHAAVRRLLYRYFYRTAEQRAKAHNEARKFVEIWAERQVGTEQVVGMVECLWHEAIVLGLREPGEMEPRLTTSARALSAALRDSSAYTLHELREFAARRMTEDAELEETVSGVQGLFGRLVEAVMNPGEQP